MAASANNNPAEKDILAEQAAQIAEEKAKLAQAIKEATALLEKLTKN